MPRLTAEQWAIARAKWEADPLLTFEDIGKEFGVSKQAVQKRSAAGGWVRQADGLAQLAARAQAKADRMIDPQIDQVVDEKRSAAEDDRAGVRAKILAKHRSEMDGPRKLAYQAMLGKDEGGRALDDEKRHSLARLAKATMDTLKGVQEMERKSWGLDAGDGGDKVIVIDRG